MVRCKFQLVDIQDAGHAQDGRGPKKFIFEPRYDTSIPEDQLFNQYTPCGRIEMIVDNPRVIEVWKLGQQYYFDATPVPAS